MTTEFHKQKLAMLGSFEPTDIVFDWDTTSKILEQTRDHWRYYNPNKPGYNRYGLSLLSLDGADTGEKDLTSIRDYNQKNNTNYNELSYRTPTRWWDTLHPISEPLKPLENFLGRSHLLRLDLGGFFPPHRDLGDSFRLISFFQCSHECLHFALQGKIQFFECNRLYYADTEKVHSLVSFKNDSILLVLNVEPCQETYNFVLKNLKAF